MSSTGKFTCEGCRKTYAWKPELAGKKVRCKCGTVMTVPASLAPEPEAPPALDDMYELAGDREEKARRTPQATAGGGLRCPSCQSDIEPGAVICLACGLNFKTGKKMQTTVGGPDLAPAPAAMARPAVTRAPVGAIPGAVGAAAIAPGAGPMLGYAARTPGAAQQNATALAGEMQNLKWPIVMVLLGLLMGYGFWIYTGLSPMQAAIVLPVALIIDMVLIFIAGLAAIKMMDISLGSPAEAVVKICAVALVPGYIYNFIDNWNPFAGMLAFFVSLGAMYALLAWFFDLDGGEMMTMAFIIIIVRCFAGMLVLVLLFSSLLSGSSASGGGLVGMMLGGGGGGGVAASEDTSTPAGRMNVRAERWLAKEGTTEAKEWIEGAKNRNIINFDHDASVKGINDLYAAGAEDVQAANVEKIHDIEQADKLIIEWPADPAVRQKILGVYASHFKDKLVAPLHKDHGPDHHYLILDFDGNPDQ